MYLILCVFLFHIAFYFFRIVAKHKGWLTRNFSGVFIPAGYGIVLFFFLLVYVVLNHQHVTKTEMALVFYTALLILIGWIDDRYGNPNIKGIKGHLTYLLHTGRVSTGCVKAFLGVGAGVGIALQLTNKPVDLLLYSGVLSLSTNFINLLDVRPGRALKGVGLFLPFIILMGTLPTHLSMYAIYLLIFCLVALPYDLKGAMMLGDAGANGLGFSLGSLLILSLSIQWIWVYFFFLLGIHWYAEKGSISTYIKQHALLRRVDEWGRNVDP
mgnify:CR=1 FL=1